MSKIYHVGIIGGGISGVTTALHLAENGVDSVLFEQKSSVVNGPPFCHLHAGGNLYPDISDEQCRLLMKQSIEMARLFPQSIDERPTFISIPKSEKYKPETIAQRLDMLVDFYKGLIEQDSGNNILGAPVDYYKAYSAEDLQTLAKQSMVKHPASADEWMGNTLKFVDYKKLKTPVFVVQEYGWNMFRLAAQAQTALNNTDNCTLKTNTQVTDINDVRDKGLDYNWEISANGEVYRVKYLVNSGGFKTGEIDESLHLRSERLIEFKAAYVSKWDAQAGLLPELIFHGERGTPNGMAQITPYHGDYYQIHGMNHDVTLFDDGLVKANFNKTKSDFNADLTQKLQVGWEQEELKQRTENAIGYAARFVPSFETATPGGPPLFGAQQIAGKDVNLRVAEVSFPDKFYARSEIIKASSALSVAHKILNNLQEDGLISMRKPKTIQNDLLAGVPKAAIDSKACEIAMERGFPGDLSRLLIEKREN